MITFSLFFFKKKKEIYQYILYDYFYKKNCPKFMKKIIYFKKIN
jgi:hypothetical protein